MLFFTFKMQLIGIHSAILGWSVTVFLTLAIKKFFPPMKLISPIIFFTLSLSLHCRSIHYAPIFLYFLRYYLVYLLTYSPNSVSWFTNYWLIDLYTPCPVHFFKRCCSGPDWGPALTSWTPSLEVLEVSLPIPYSELV